MLNSKKVLRKIYKQKRSELSNTDIDHLSNKILHNLKKIDIWDKKNYHIYLSSQSNNEVKTEEIINFLFVKNKKVIVPKVIDNIIIHIEIDKNSHYDLNKFGIKEPISLNKIDNSILDIVIVPLLCFDKRGHRVGYGGGYYDRFLNDVDAIKIGLSIFEPVEEIKDINEYDISLDYVVTPGKLYDFRPI